MKVRDTLQNIPVSRARDGSGMSRRRCRWFSARRRRPEEAPRTGGRGRAARAPAQNHGIRQGEYERTARRPAREERPA